MQTKIIERYFFFTLLFISIIFVLLLFKPFISIIIIGASLATMLFPVYTYFQKTKMPDWFSAICVVILFIFVLCGPLLGIGILIFNQSQEVYTYLISGGDSGPFLRSLEYGINNILPYGITINISEKISYMVGFVLDNVSQIFATTLSTIFGFLLTILSLFYFLKDGIHWKKALIVLSPLSDKDDEKILEKLSTAVNGVVKGYLLIGLTQGTLMGIGMAIFGIPNPAVWGLVTAIVSMIPTVGTALVSIPAIIFLFVMGQSVQAIGMLAWSIAIVGIIDNLLNPIIVGSKIHVPPLLILFSVLGGISLLGPVGILIGPLAVSLLYTLVSIYRNEFKKDIGL